MSSERLTVKDKTSLSGQPGSATLPPMENGGSFKIVVFTILALSFGQLTYLKLKYLLSNDLPVSFSNIYSFGDASYGLASTTIVALIHIALGQGLKRWLGEASVKLRYALQFILSALLGGLAAAGAMVIYVSVLNDYPTPDTGSLVDVAVSAFLTPLTLIATLETFHYRGAWLKEQVRKEQTKRDMISVQFEALKNQLSPHFVFNSFNSLGALIETQPERALVFLNHLSQVYRYILDNKDRETVSLEDELESVKAYLHIQEERHPDTMDITINLKKNDLTLRVIPLTLHTLVENVFKHNILSTKTPIRMTIEVRDGPVLVVVNDLKPKLDVESHQIGIANLSRRYELLVSRGLRILRDTSHFQVEVPTIPDRVHLA